MIDTWRAQAALNRLGQAIGYPRDESISELVWAVESEIDNIECLEEHPRGDYESDEDWVEVTALSGFLEQKLSRLRMGVYDVEREGDTLAVLEEIERILRNG